MIEELRKGLEEYIDENYEPEFLSFKSLALDTCCLGLDFEKGKARTLDDAVKNIGETFQEMLFRLIDEKGLTDVKVYTDAHMDRKLFSKIRSKKDYRPKKNNVLLLCFSMKLNIDESVDLLEKLGYAFSNSSLSDIILKYFIEKEFYDLNEINEIYYEYTKESLY